MSENLEVRIGQWSFSQAVPGGSTVTDASRGAIQIAGSNDTDANFRTLSTQITLGKAHPYMVPVLGWAGNGISTAYAPFEVDVPPGAGFIRKAVVEFCGVVPSTDCQVRLGLFDHDSTPTLYTGAVSSLWAGAAYGSTVALNKHTFRPGADFTLTPYDVVKDTGNTRLVGYVELHNAAVSTLYITCAKIFFGRKSGNRA